MSGGTAPKKYLEEEKRKDIEEGKQKTLFQEDNKLGNDRGNEE